MKQLITLISALFFFTVGVSQVWALPNCVGSYLNPFSNLMWTQCKGSHTFGPDSEREGGIYIGEFKSGDPHGQGTYTYVNGDKYVGEFQDDKRNGQGIYTYANGNKYVGEYKDGVSHGQGTFTWADGGKYVGEHKNGLLDGQGTYTWADGGKYVGEYKDGMRHGQGTYTYANGAKEVGAWENDNLNGYAITYYADGSINQEGIFKDNKFLYAQKKSKIDKHKEFCEEIGFTPKTESFANCVLKLMEKN